MKDMKKFKCIQGTSIVTKGLIYDGYYDDNTPMIYTGEEFGYLSYNYEHFTEVKPGVDSDYVRGLRDALDIFETRNDIVRARINKLIKENS